jgi:signal transduction histidine kinase
MNQWFEVVERQPRGVLAAASLGLVLLIGLIDYVTGPQISFSVVYVIPIALAASTIGIRFAYFLSILSVALWVEGNILGGHKYTQSWIPFWNGGIRLTFYAIVANLLVSVKSLQYELEGRVRQRTAALTKEIAERERLEHELLEVSDREQRRIGYDLHDSLCQHLTGTALASQVLGDKLALRQLPEAHDANKVVELIEEGISLSRRLAKGLNPVELSADGLMQALDEFAATTSDLFNVECRFECEYPVLIKDTMAAVHLYRIAQEAVGNAIKHGGADRVVISLEAHEEGTVLSIEDDGRGLPDPIPSKGGMGLRIMANRAKMIGAGMEFRCGHAGGTIVICTRPSISREPVLIHG